MRTFHAQIFYELGNMWIFDDEIFWFVVAFHFAELTHAIDGLYRNTSRHKGFIAGPLWFAQTVFYLQELVFSSLLPVIVSYSLELVDLGGRSFLVYFVPETLKFSVLELWDLNIHCSHDNL